MLQLLHENYEDPLTSLMPCILNTLHYVATVLEEWGVTVVSILYIKYMFQRDIFDILSNFLFLAFFAIILLQATV